MFGNLPLCFIKQLQWYFDRKGKQNTANFKKAVSQTEDKKKEDWRKYHGRLAAWAKYKLFSFTKVEFYLVKLES